MCDMRRVRRIWLCFERASLRYVCDRTHSYVCDMTHSYVCDMTHSYVCDRTHSYV